MGKEKIKKNKPPKTDHREKTLSALELAAIGKSAHVDNGPVEMEMETEDSDWTPLVEEARGKKGNWLKRLVAEDINFQVGGAPVEGKVGFPVSAGVAKLFDGAAIDLRFSKLTGRAQDHAEGTGGMLVLAPVGMKNAVPVNMNKVDVTPAGVTGEADKISRPMEFYNDNVRVVATRLTLHDDRAELTDAVELRKDKHGEYEVIQSPATITQSGIQYSEPAGAGDTANAEEEHDQEANPAQTKVNDLLAKNEAGDEHSEDEASAGEEIYEEFEEQPGEEVYEEFEEQPAEEVHEEGGNMDSQPDTDVTPPAQELFQDLKKLTMDKIKAEYDLLPNFNKPMPKNPKNIPEYLSALDQAAAEFVNTLFLSTATMTVSSGSGYEPDPSGLFIDSTPDGDFILSTENGEIDAAEETNLLNALTASRNGIENAIFNALYLLLTKEPIQAAEELDKMGNTISEFGKNNAGVYGDHIIWEYFRFYCASLADECAAEANDPTNEDCMLGMVQKLFDANGFAVIIQEELKDRKNTAAMNELIEGDEDTFVNTVVDQAKTQLGVDGAAGDSGSQTLSYESKKDKYYDDILLAPIDLIGPDVKFDVTLKPDVTYSFIFSAGTQELRNMALDLYRNAHGAEADRDMSPEQTGTFYNGQAVSEGADQTKGALPHHAGGSRYQTNNPIGRLKFNAGVKINIDFSISAKPQPQETLFTHRLYDIDGETDSVKTNNTADAALEAGLDIPVELSSKDGMHLAAAKDIKAVLKDKFDKKGQFHKSAKPYFAWNKKLYESYFSTWNIKPFDYQFNLTKTSFFGSLFEDWDLEWQTYSDNLEEQFTTANPENNRYGMNDEKYKESTHFKDVDQNFTEAMRMLKYLTSEKNYPLVVTEDTNNILSHYFEIMNISAKAYTESQKELERLKAELEQHLNNKGHKSDRSDKGKTNVGGAESPEAVYQELTEAIRSYEMINTLSYDIISDLDYIDGYPEFILEKIDELENYWKLMSQKDHTAKDHQLTLKHLKEKVSQALEDDK